MTCSNGYTITNAGSDTATCTANAGPTLKAAGSQCSASSECSSNKCLGNVCCASGVDPNCQTCSGANGYCNACTGTYSMSNAGTASATCTAPPSLKAAGLTCSANSECSSSKCLGNVCCASGVTSNCQTCAGTNGYCATCSSGYSISGQGTASATCTTTTSGGGGTSGGSTSGGSGTSSSNLAAGSTCSSDSQCASGKCKGSVCCKDGVGSCTTCSSSDGGGCSVCATGYFRDPTTLTCVFSGVQPGFFSFNPLNECAVAGRATSGICCASFLCDTCRSGDGMCNSCDIEYSSSALPSSGVCYTKSNSVGAGGSACSSSGECMSGVCVNSKCTDCTIGFALYNGVCTLKSVIPGVAPPPSTGGGGSTTGGGTAPAPVTVLPDASATLAFRKYSAPLFRRELESEGEEANTAEDARFLASTSLDQCVIACAKGGIAVGVSSSATFTLRPFVKTTTLTSISGPVTCTCPESVTATGTGSTSVIATGTFNQDATTPVTMNIKFNQEGYIDIDMTLGSSGSFSTWSFSYFLVSCAVKFSSSSLASSLCKATVSLDFTSGSFDSAASTSISNAVGPTVFQCYQSCLAAGWYAVAIGTNTVVFSPRDPSPSSTCNCPAVPAQMASSTLIQAQVDTLDVAITAGTTTPSFAFKLFNKEVGRYNYKVASCLGPSDFCSPYSSTTTATTGKRSSNYVSDTLVTSVDSCTRACVVGGYQISVSGTTATLTPITMKPYTGCTCQSISGTVSGGTITGSATPATGGASVGFTVTSPANDQVAMSLSQSGTNSGLGSVSFASAGCTQSSTNFCGDAAPAPASSGSSSFPIAIVAGAAGGAVGLILLIVGVMFCCKIGCFSYRRQYYEEEDDSGSWGALRRVTTKYANKYNASSFKSHENPLGAAARASMHSPAGHENPAAGAARSSLYMATSHHRNSMMYASPHPIRAGSARALMAASPPGSMPRPAPPPYYVPSVTGSSV
jgi:hypothetical protein